MRKNILISILSLVVASLLTTGCGTEDSDEGSGSNEPTVEELAELEQYLGEGYSLYSGQKSKVYVSSIDAQLDSMIEFNIKFFRDLENNKTISFFVEPFQDTTFRNTSSENYVGSAAFECNGKTSIKCVDVKKITCEVTNVNTNANNYFCYLNDDRTLTTVQSKKTVRFSNHSDTYILPDPATPSGYSTYTGENNFLIVTILTKAHEGVPKDVHYMTETYGASTHKSYAVDLITGKYYETARFFVNDIYRHSLKRDENYRVNMLVKPFESREQIIFVD